MGRMVWLLDIQFFASHSFTLFCCVCFHVCVCVCLLTCWSTPTASRPSYMMLTQPSLHDRTNSDISAWKSETRANQSHCQSVCNSRCQSRMCACVCSSACDKPVPGCQSCISGESSGVLPVDTVFYW